MSQDKETVLTSLFAGKAMTHDEVAGILKSASEPEVAGAAVVEILLSSKDPVWVNELIDITSVITKQRCAEYVATSADEYKAGFVTGMIHGIMLMTCALKLGRPVEPAKAAVAVSWLGLISLGRLVPREEWPEEITDAKN